MVSEFPVHHKVKDQQFNCKTNSIAIIHLKNDKNP